MYRIFIGEVENKYEMNEMVRMFLPSGAYEILEEDPWETIGRETDGREILIRIPDGIREKNQGKRILYEELAKATGKRLEWGILTGVRPVKLAGEITRAVGSPEKARKVLLHDYLVSEEKADLLLSIRELQQKVIRERDPAAVGLYIGIPFCPTRCLYCSFPSNQAKEEQIDAYLKALAREIAFVGERMEQTGFYPESVYIGGGTPTTLSAEQMAELLEWVKKAFDLSQIREFTVEAGRPDTVTADKLQAILEGGGDRICINPQSMKERTLELIGRNHSRLDVELAFALARRMGVSAINADLIAGLPEEGPEDFETSLQKIMALSPENITVHTLAVKRASRLKELYGEYSYRQGERVRIMLQKGNKRLTEAGYRPYYLYRQKQMAGNFENVGYALPGTESLYNIRIMEEDQTVLALGAGGISKVWYPAENRLERVPNVSNYEIYIQRIEEMLERKEKSIFSVVQRSNTENE